MAEYIDREEAKVLFRYWITDCELYGDHEEANHFRDAIDGIDSLPAKDVIPVVHGKWIEYEASDSDLDPRCRCSKCGSVETPLARHSYCPNCGAKMDKEGPDAG